MELSASQWEELNSFSAPVYLPSQTSIMASEQTRLLFDEIRGDDRYREKLTTYSNELLKVLVQSNPSLAKPVQRQLHEHRAALAVIVHSLAHVASHPKDYQVIAVSLNSNDYRPKGPFSKLSYSLTSRLVTMLTKPEIPHALCWIRNGTFDHTRKEGIRTRLRPHLAFKNQLMRAGLVWASHPYNVAPKVQDNLLYIKNQKTKKKEALVRTLSASEEVLPLVNARLRKAQIGFEFPDYRSYERLFFNGKSYSLVANGQLHRQFVDNERSGGRLNGHPIQNLPKELRQYLRINGNPVLEYDYQAMQLALAYHAEMEEPPKGDLYEIPGYEEYRDKFKACFTSAIGTSENHNLMSVFSHAIQNQTGSFLKPGLAKELSEAFWSYHKPLRYIANTEAWRKLQFAESEIMLDVLRRLEAKGIIAIPIHDAVIVPFKHAFELNRAMRHAVGHIEFKMPVIPAKWTIEAYPQLQL